jgi:hypothetical protein
MAKISIQNLDVDHSCDLTSKLSAHEYTLVESALKRALDARKIKGGTVSILLPRPTIGLVYQPPEFFAPPLA